VCFQVRLELVQQSANLQQQQQQRQKQYILQLTHAARQGMPLRLRLLL
jgi:hypothetical protein